MTSSQNAPSPSLKTRLFTACALLALVAGLIGAYGLIKVKQLHASNEQLYRAASGAMSGPAEKAARQERELAGAAQKGALFMALFGMLAPLGLGLFLQRSLRRSLGGEPAEL